jgi:hypothetical protein
MAQKWKVKDNGLQRALAAYEKLDEKEHAERLKAIGTVSQLAGALGKKPEVAAIPIVATYLGNVDDAAECEQREITKASVMTAKKAEAEGKKQEKEEDAFQIRLLAALQKLKSARDLSYEFIACDAKPYWGVMVAPRITAKHKDELTRLTGGSKRFLHPGTCRFDEGKFAFSMENPVSGLARKIQDSILHFCGKKLPIVAGQESVEDDSNV